MSYCELCGRQSPEKLKVVVDGTVFNVCVACSKHGKPYVPPNAAIVKKKKKAMPARQGSRITMSDQTMLAADFARRIREARMKLGLTHEQLAMKMNEKVQQLRKFETGALKPDEILAKKLERFLGIKLYVSIDDETGEGS
ncbi:MAG TPA: multiprotein bridging factor aMBF1 [Nitrososphaera sp.]|nr:multiprotein bridging factor aMBF1 [Nitrososphaera sp.]